jgi:hypothetical protein
LAIGYNAGSKQSGKLEEARMRILVFLHGTTIMHAAGAGHTREERVRQVIERDPSVRDYAAYIPIGDAPEKLRRWQAQGATISYLSSHRRPEDVEIDIAVLRRYDFPEGDVFARQEGEDYGVAALRARPNVLIEDDCESIGGEVQMTYPRLEATAQEYIISIVVPEMGGIDHLADDCERLGKR